MIVDAAILAFVGTFVWRGLRRGLVNALAGLIGFIVAAAAAVLGYRALAPVIHASGVSEGLSNLAAALVIFVALTIAFRFAGRALTRLLRLTKWGAVNAAGGAALSGAWALSWVTAVVLATSVIPLSEPLDRQLASSTLAAAIAEEAPGWLGRLARTDLREMLLLFTPDERRVALVATADYGRAPYAERELFDRANEERRARGLEPLRWDEGLAQAARAHAGDMYRRGYFGHDSPEGDTPADRLRRRRVSFRVAAENLALAPSVAIAHNRLMGSRRHRAHILGERFARLGVGVMFGPQGLVITQEFAA